MFGEKRVAISLTNPTKFPGNTRFQLDLPHLVISRIYPESMDGELPTKKKEKITESSKKKHLKLLEWRTFLLVYCIQIGVL